MTRIGAYGLDGEAAILLTVIDRSVQNEFVAALTEVASTAFWTIEEMRSVRPAPLPNGINQVGDIKRRRLPVIEPTSNFQGSHRARRAHPGATPGRQTRLVLADGVRLQAR